MATAVRAQAVTFVIPFADIRLEDVPLVGGKNASLGEMYNALRPVGIRVPDGFAITADAYGSFARSRTRS